MNENDQQKLIEAIKIQVKHEQYRRIYGDSWEKVYEEDKDNNGLGNKD